MFESTRLKLTGWYLLIIMCISMLFSVVIYTGIERELGRFERAQIMRGQMEEQFFGRPLPSRLAQIEMVNEARFRIIITLILVNLGILGVSGLAGYFLAGRTLAPIAHMVDEQNRFITDASHELRTPLTSLRTSIEVNLRNTKLTLSEAKALLRSNLEEVESLQSLANDLIHLAQFQKPISRAAFSLISLDAIVAQAVAKMTPQASAKAITLQITGHDGKIEADKKSMQELLIILLDNAIKYSRQKSEVTITISDTDHDVTIQVADRGIGIDPDDLPHIFDRFYRAEKSRSKDISGYGLGLSVAKTIVALHQGTIAVKSKKDEGTAFTITLPKRLAKEKSAIS